MSLHIVRVRQPGVALFTAPFHRALFRHPTPKSRLRLQTPTGPPNDGYTHLQPA